MDRITRFALVFTLVSTLLCTAVSAQTTPCTVGITSRDASLPEHFIEKQLALLLGEDAANVYFNRSPYADVVVEARYTLPDSPFRLAVSVRQTSTGVIREALHPETNGAARERVVREMAASVRRFCGTAGMARVVATARLQPEPEASASPADCRLQPVRALALYSETSALDEYDLGAAIRRDRDARRLALSAAPAPGPGAQVTIRRALGSHLWSFTIADEAGTVCRQELFVLKESDAYARLARAIVTQVALTRGVRIAPDDVPAPVRTFRVEAFGGIPGVKQGRRLLLALESKTLVLSTPEGMEILRIPAAALQDVSTNDWAPTLHSDFDAQFNEAISKCGDAACGVGVLVGATVYATIGHTLDFVRSPFVTEHFLDVAWRGETGNRTASFKLRGRDAKAVRTRLEVMVEAARLAPAERPRGSTLLAQEK